MRLVQRCVDAVVIAARSEETGLWRIYRHNLAVASWCRDAGVRWINVQQTGVFRRLLDRDRRSEHRDRWMAVGPLAAPASNDIARIRLPPALIDVGTATDQLLESPQSLRLSGCAA